MQQYQNPLEKHTLTARGTQRTTGVRTIAASWNGAIEVELTHVDGKDLFSVRRIPWQGNGEREDLAKGEL